MSGYDVIRCLERPTPIFKRPGFDRALLPQIIEGEPGIRINRRPAPAVPLNLQNQLERVPDDPPVGFDDDHQDEAWPHAVQLARAGFEDPREPVYNIMQEQESDDEGDDALFRNNPEIVEAEVQDQQDMPLIAEVEVEAVQIYVNSMTLQREVPVVQVMIMGTGEVQYLKDMHHEEGESRLQIDGQPAPAVPLNLEYQLERVPEDPPVDSDNKFDESEPKDEAEPPSDSVMAPLEYQVVELPLAGLFMSAEVDEAVPTAVILEVVPVEEEAAPVPEVVSTVDAGEGVSVEENAADSVGSGGVLVEESAASVVEENLEGLVESPVEDEANGAIMLQQMTDVVTDGKFIASCVAMTPTPIPQSQLTTASTVNISDLKVAVPGLERSKSQNQLASQKGREVNENVPHRSVFNAESR